LLPWPRIYQFFAWAAAPIRSGKTVDREGEGGKGEEPEPEAEAEPESEPEPEAEPEADAEPDSEWSLLHVSNIHASV